MIKKNLRMVFPLAIMAILVISPAYFRTAEAANPEPFFYLDFLAPNTNPARNQWATLMTEQLPKIGIGIDTFDHTGWAQISPRTWGYSGAVWDTNPVPTYDEGGFDLLFVGWSWGLDWDPQGLLDTPGITPNGNNYYQYSSSEMDTAITNYGQAFVTEDRISYAEEIQAIIYEDLPMSTIIYPRSLYPHDENLEGWDGLLWASSYQPMENWSIAGQTEFHYAASGAFEDFHIHKYESVYDAQWLRQIYNGLIERQAPDRTWYDRLTTDYSTTDGLTYTVTLDSNAKWADGTDFTPEDVVYNYNLVIDPDFASPDAGTYLQYWDNTSVTVIDPNTVQFEFLKTYVFQESNLALDLIPKHIWESIDPADHESQAVTWMSDPDVDEYMFGMGPYKVADYDSTNQVIHLTANTYFGDLANFDAPKFDDIYFNTYSNKEGALSALAAGTVDMVDAQFSPQIDELTGITGASYSLVEDPGTQEMGYNMIHPYIGTGESCPIAGAESAKHVRHAINHMIPRETIVSEILNDLASPGVTCCPDVAIGYDVTLEPAEYSIELAKNEMRAAGFVYEGDTVGGGIGLVVLMSILALAGASQVFFLKRRK